MKNKLNKEKLYSVLIFSIYFSALCILLSSCAISKPYKATSNIDCKVFQKSKYDIQTGLYSE